MPKSNVSECTGCETLLAQASETQGCQVEIAELQDQVATLRRQCNDKQVQIDRLTMFLEYCRKSRDAMHAHLAELKVEGY